MKINPLTKAILLATNTKARYLDQHNICWKYIDGKFIGKRSVFTHDLKSLWLEETTPENVRTWWCGKDADYNEIFVE